MSAPGAIADHSQSGNRRLLVTHSRLLTLIDFDRFHAYYSAEEEVDMNEKSEAIRAAVFEEIELLAHASLQTKYEKDVPIANVPAELFCGFCDDLYHPKSQTFLDAFNEEEIKDLAVLYGLLHLASQTIDESEILSVADLQKRPEWRLVMNFAKELESRYGISRKTHSR